MMFYYNYRMVTSESIQYFQFDNEGNMYIYPAGSGCTGVPKLVHPGDELNFQSTSDSFTDRTGDGIPSWSEFDASASSKCTQNSVCLSRPFNNPLNEDELEDLSHKNFSPDAMKKVKWAVKMYRDWHNHQNSIVGLDNISCDLDDKSTISQSALTFALSRFITEVEKIDGSDFPGKTLYEILVMIQFHLETMGLSWKLINDEMFREVKYTLDNMVKLRTAQGVGTKVRKAEILSVSDEELLWSFGLLGAQDAETLLNTMVFIIGKGFALHAGKEHQKLRSSPFDSHFEFFHDSDGEIFIRYKEDLGLKTNKGGIKQRKIEPKEVDMYQIGNISRCPVYIFLTYLSKLPRIESAIQCTYNQRKK